MSKKRALEVEVDTPLNVKVKVEGDVGASLRVAMENINAKKGVIGYILRGPTSASVDIKDPGKIIDYAVLSTTIFESSEGFSHLFGLGRISSVVLEGKDAKILCLTKGDHRLSVFMEKSVDHNSIYKKLT